MSPGDERYRRAGPCPFMKTRIRPTRPKRTHHVLFCVQKPHLLFAVIIPPVFKQREENIMQKARFLLPASFCEFKMISTRAERTSLSCSCVIQLKVKPHFSKRTQTLTCRSSLLINHKARASTTLFNGQPSHYPKRPLPRVLTFEP